jgi:hypothetical protein
MHESRRAALKRLGLLLGGAAAVVVGSGSPTVSRQPEVQRLTLEGKGWHIYSREIVRGALPTGGDRMLAYGDLYEPDEGPRVGQFFATYFSLHQPGVFGVLTSLEQHTFNLPDGAIMGSGTTKPGLASEDEFAILGGTGRYAGARGTYVVRQSHREFGGDGTAAITFQILQDNAGSEPGIPHSA